MQGLAQLRHHVKWGVLEGKHRTGQSLEGQESSVPAEELSGYLLGMESHQVTLRGEGRG